MIRVASWSWGYNGQFIEPFIPVSKMIEEGERGFWNHRRGRVKLGLELIGPGQDYTTGASLMLLVITAK